MRIPYRAFSIILPGISAATAALALFAGLSAPLTAQALAPAQPTAAQQAASPSAAATDAAGQQAPLLRLNVRRVPVDVVVQDKQGNPIRGLKAADFIIKEDGKVQAINSFDATNGSILSFVPPKLPALPANTFVDLPDAPERGPLYILYYDMVNTSPDDQMSFHRELLKFIDDAPPGTRMALFVNASRLQLVQGFTSNHVLLHAAVERQGPGPHVPKVFAFGEVFGRFDAGAALSNLKFIAEYMSGLPGRKNLIWMSSNFPIPGGPTLVGSGALATASMPAHAGSLGAMGGPEVLDLSELLSDTIKSTYSAMMRAQVALYPVNLNGVEGSEAGGAEADGLADYQNMDVIANTTGGHAYYGNNRTGQLLDKAVENGENYYTLSYAPTNTKFDGSARQIQVALPGKESYKLTYRTIYYALPDTQPAEKKDKLLEARFVAAKESDTLYANIEHGAPMVHDLLFSAHLAAVGSPALATPAQMADLEDSPAYFRTRHKDRPLTPLPPVKLQKYRIDYGVIDPQLKAEAQLSGTPAILEFAAAAYDADGKLLNSMLNDGMASADAKAARQIRRHLPCRAGARSPARRNLHPRSRP